MVRNVVAIRKEQPGPVGFCQFQQPEEHLQTRDAQGAVGAAFGQGRPAASAVGRIVLLGQFGLLLADLFVDDAAEHGELRHAGPGVVDQAAFAVAVVPDRDEAAGAEEFVDPDFLDLFQVERSWGLGVVEDNDPLVGDGDEALSEPAIQGQIAGQGVANGFVLAHQFAQLLHLADGKFCVEFHMKILLWFIICVGALPPGPRSLSLCCHRHKK